MTITEKNVGCITDKRQNQQRSLWISIFLLCLLFTSFLTTACTNAAFVVGSTRVEIDNDASRNKPDSKNEGRLKQVEDQLNQVKDQLSRLEQSTMYVPSGRYAVQIKAMKNQWEAEQYTAGLKKYGLKADCQKSYIASKQSVWYQVRVGRFADKGSAEHYKNEILALGFVDDDAFVTDWNVPYQPET